MRILMVIVLLTGCSVDTSNLRLGVWKTSKSAGGWQCVESSKPYSNKEC
jgi:hypothetical protein